MRRLVSEAGKLFADIFNRKTKERVENRIKPGPQRFILEFLESRVLLSADPLNTAALIGEAKNTAEAPAIISPTEDGTPDANADAQPADEGEGEDGGDFIDGEAYNETYGTFDFDTFQNLNNGGALGGKGGAVDEAATP